MNIHGWIGYSAELAHANTQQDTSANIAKRCVTDLLCLSCKLLHSQLHNTQVQCFMPSQLCKGG